MEELKPPIPFFGGKSRAASLIWRGLGDVVNYIEPFAGSLAVLFNRPHEPLTETVNDVDAFIANFWRAVALDPEAVAEHADYPVSEVDLHARHYWLITEGRRRLAALMTDPEGHDAKIAGWWAWGACSWIGSGWCSGDGRWAATKDGWVSLRNAGQGVNRQLPHLGDAGKAHPHREHLIGYMRRLQNRLRYVRIACGDWRRVLTPSVTFRHGTTGILLDPPYGEGGMDYAAGGNACAGVADAVREWAIENGGNPDLRIALCGYDGQHEMPGDWRVDAWKAAGGYSSTAAGDTEGKENRHRERVWFSPACEGVMESAGLFGTAP